MNGCPNLFFQRFPKEEVTSLRLLLEDAATTSHSGQTGRLPLEYDLDVTDMGEWEENLIVWVEYLKDLKVADRRYNSPIITPCNMHISLCQQ